MEIVIGFDGIARCSWGSEPEIYRVYHDEEWGRANNDDRAHFEKVCLEGFQAGLSWLTILRKRPDFRRAFAGFDPEVVAGFGEADVTRLLTDETIVRHEGKIRSAINNAERALDLIDEVGSLTEYFWSWASPEDDAPVSIPALTETSTALSKDLKKRGWTFVGPTTMYAFMQSMGLVNDHLAECDVRAACASQRRDLISAR